MEYDAGHSSHGKRRSYARMARAARRTSIVSTASACVLLLAAVLVSCAVAEPQNKTVWVGGVNPAVHWHPGHPGCTHAPAPAIHRAAPETVIELCEPGLQPWALPRTERVLHLLCDCRCNDGREPQSGARRAWSACSYDSGATDHSVCADRTNEDFELLTGANDLSGRRLLRAYCPGGV